MVAPLPSAPSVSVVIPCYNSARYLTDTAHSVLSQSLQDMEIVLVDDGSTDHTIELIGKLIADNPRHRFQCLSQRNGGVACARNLGIANALGRYIIPLDSDDQLAPGMLEECARLLDENDELSVVYTDRMDFGDFEEYQAAGNYRLSSLKYFNQLAYCCMYRKSVWSDIGGYRRNVSGFDDWDFWIALASRKNPAVHIAKPLLLHRRHRSSQLWDIVEEYELLFAQIILNNREVYSTEELAMAECFLETGESSALISASKFVFLGCYFARYQDKGIHPGTQSRHL